MIDNIESYQNLLNAIVLQAIEDYKSSFKTIKCQNYVLRKSRELENKMLRFQCEYFFNSKWFKAICQFTDLNDKSVRAKVEEIRMTYEINNEVENEKKNNVNM